MSEIEPTPFSPLHESWDEAADMWPEWTEAVRQAFLLARGARLGELHGRRARLLDARGLHPYSEVWGVIGALASEEIGQWIIDNGLRLSPELLRRVAAEDAETEFADALVRARASRDTHEGQGEENG